MYTIDATTGALTSIGTIAMGPFPNTGSRGSGGQVRLRGDGERHARIGRQRVHVRDQRHDRSLSIHRDDCRGNRSGLVAVDPAGKFAYVTNSGSNNVSMYTINATTGSLTQIGAIAAGTSPSSIAIHPSGKFVYVTNSGSNDVSMYTINATTGSLTQIGAIAAGMSPGTIVIHPSGKFAYLLNSGSNDVSIYSIGSTGTLTLIGTIGA